MESAVLTVSVHCTRVNTTPLPCGYPNKRKYKKSDTYTTGTRFSKECTSVSYFLWWVPLPEVSKTATAARDPVYTTWACGDAAQCRQRRSISWSPRLRPPHNTKCIWPPSKSPQSLNNSNTVQKSKCKVSFETKSTLLIVSPPRIKNVTYIQQYRADFSPLKWNGIYWERRNGAKTRRKSARQTGNPTALCPASGALMGCCELQQAWPVPSAPHALLGGAYNSCPKFSCPDTATGEQGSRVAEDELRAKSVSSPTSCVLGTH